MLSDYQKVPSRISTRPSSQGWAAGDVTRAEPDSALLAESCQPVPAALTAFKPASLPVRIRFGSFLLQTWDLAPSIPKQRVPVPVPVPVPALCQKPDQGCKGSRWALDTTPGGLGQPGPYFASQGKPSPASVNRRQPKEIATKGPTLRSGRCVVCTGPKVAHCTASPPEVD